MKIAAFVALISLGVSSGPAQLIFHGNTHGPLIALTFDAGADRGYAATIIATLEHNRLRATFGMTGRWAQQNSDLVRRMAQDDDVLMNHTYDHRSFTGFSTHLAPLSEAQRAREIEETDRIVRGITHRTTKPYWRPPFGDYDPATLTLVRKLGYRYVVMWTVDSLGWERLSAKAIVARCLTHASPGEILLMHVGAQSQDAQALPTVISALRSRGYRFVTVPQLLAAH